MSGAGQRILLMLDQTPPVSHDFVPFSIFNFKALFKHTTTTKGYLVTSEESVWASRGLNETFNSIKPDDVEGQPLYPPQILFCWESIAIFPSATLPFQICHLLESQAQNICRKSRGKKVASDDDEARWNMWPWDMVPCLLKSKPHNPRLFSCFFFGRRDRYEKTTLFWAETCVRGSQKLLVRMVGNVGGKNASYMILMIYLTGKHGCMYT